MRFENKSVIIIGGLLNVDGGFHFV